MKPFAQYPKRRSHQLLVVCALALPLAMVGQLLEQPPPYFQQAYLKASERSAWFGNSVAVSGDTAVVAEYYSAAYIFARKEGRWTREAHLQDLILQGHLETSQKSVAVAGDTVVLGDIDQGVHVFVRNGTNWFRQAHLERFGGGFGWSVALAGDTLVVGAPADDSSVIGVNGDPRDNGAFNSGAAYIFVRDGTNWIQQAYLKASNAGTEDYFGASVAMAGDTVVVRASGEDSNATGVNGNQSDNSALNSGAAYIFVRNGTNWTQQAYLKAYNTGVGNFGSSVAVSGDTVVVGAPGDQNNNAMRSGTAYVFVRSGTNWLYEANLQASNAEAGDGFGGSVAVSEDTVVVGSLLEDSSAMGVNGDEIDNSAADSGAAYVFTRSGTNWIQKAYLKASNTGSIDVFGFSVALSGDTVVIGAIWESSSAMEINGDQCDNNASGAGAVYVFDPHGSIPPGEIAIQHPTGIGLTDGSTSVSFGSRRLDYSSQRTFTIRNNSASVTLTGLDITITGPNASDFTVTSFPATTVPPCGSTMFTVALSAGSPSAKTAYLHIASNDGDESPFDITLNSSIPRLPLPNLTNQGNSAAMSRSHVLKIDGTLWTLGDGTTNNPPVQIGGCDWRGIGDGWATKADHTLWRLAADPTQVGTDNDWATVADLAALKADGSLWLLIGGDGDPIPQRIGTDSDWAVLDGALALKSDGSLWEWITSTQIGTDQDWAAIAAGATHSLLLKQDGSIWGWVNGDPVCLDPGTDWIAVDTRSYIPSGDNGGGGGGGGMDLALKRDGSLWGRVRTEDFVHVGDNVSLAVAGNVQVGGVFGGGSHYSYFTLGTDGALRLSEWRGEGGITTINQLQTRRIGDDIDWGAPHSLPLSNELRIVRHALGSDAQFRAVVGALSNDCYSVLYRGSSVTNISQPVDLRLSLRAQAFQLTDSTPASSNAPAFYRVRQIANAHPLDSDGDDIDDVYELRHSGFLNPLDPSDASDDFDGDGKSNLEEYVDGTDPELP